MSTYGDKISRLGDEVTALPQRSRAQLFVALARALRPGFDRWNVDPVRANALDDALRAAADFAATSTSPANSTGLLAAMEALTPEGDGLDVLLSTTAQDCWICADAALRAAAGDPYATGDALWYAVEPQLQHVTEDLFGVTELGDGPALDAQEREVRADPRVEAALEFVRSELRRLRVDGGSAVDPTVLEVEARRVLLPPPAT